MMRHRSALCAVLVLFITGPIRAESLSFTELFVANFEFQLLGGTAINPGPASPFIPFEAVGDLTFVFGAALNDPTATTVPITSVTGTLEGVSPPGFLPYAISPDLQFLGGELTNVVRDGSGNVISADLTDLEMRWTMVTPDLTLYTQVGLPFNGPITSIPFSVGTVISGPEDFNVYLEGGGPDPVVVGRDRTLTAVPEPGSLVLSGAAILMLGTLAARRSRSYSLRKSR